MMFAGKLIGFIPTSDAARARAFYEGVLEMGFVEDDGFALVMEAGGTMIRIVRVGEFAPARFTLVGWEVAEIESVVKAVSSKGVEFERYGLPGQGDDGVWSAPGGAKVAWFKDPDGNVLSITEHVERT